MGNTVSGTHDDSRSVSISDESGKDVTMSRVGMELVVIARAWLGPAALGLLLVACDRSPQPAEPPTVVAEVEGVPITSAEIDETLARPLAELEGQIYSLRKERLDEIIGERLLAAEAARRQIPVDVLLDQETAGRSEVTDAELAAVVAANKARWTGTDDELRRRVLAEMRRQKTAAARQAFIDRLRSSADVVVSLPPPAIHRFDVPVEGAAAVRGAADAAITIVEFTDFHCPYCRVVQPTLAEIQKRYGRHVRLVQHDVPIDQIHPQARPAHEAARCAGEQGRFWEYRERLFATAPAPPSGLDAIARDLGLDSGAFAACRTSQAVRDAVTRDSQLASSLGVQSTPTFFINGRLVLGAQPLEQFLLVIDDELRRAGIEAD
jgi:protein-disulfide isomerase